MDWEPSDAILVDAIGLADSFKSKEVFNKINSLNYEFGNYIASQSYSSLHRMVNSVENSQTKLNNNYKVLQSILKEINEEKSTLNEFDKLIKAWAAEIDADDNLIPEFNLSPKQPSDMAVTDIMRNELYDLADTMKGRVLTYKNILTRDNKKLHISTTLQQKELMNIQASNEKSSLLESKKSISFMKLLFMIISSIASLFVCLAVMLLS